MKKILSAFLITIILALSCCVCVSAASLSDGISTIRKEFQDGEYNFDFKYFSPVKGKNDSTKYPLIVWLHGQFSGNYKGFQIEKSDVAYWAADEHQASIKGTGGAYILVPRDPTVSANLAWNGEIGDIKKLIDSFVNEHRANIDTDRIYIGGYSMGGKAAIKIAAAYPYYFAAVYPLAPVYSPTDSEVRALINTPVWLFTCTSDTYFLLTSNAQMSKQWEYLCSISNCRSSLRWTKFDAPLYEYNGTPILMVGYSTHNVWDPVCHDLYMKSGSLYPNMRTINGFSTNVTITKSNSFLSWLSSQTLSGDGLEGEEGDDSGSSGGSSGSSSSSGLTFYHIREILEYITSLFYKVYEILFG